MRSTHAPGQCSRPPFCCPMGYGLLGLFPRGQLYRWNGDFAGSNSVVVTVGPGYAAPSGLIVTTN